MPTALGGKVWKPTRTANHECEARRRRTGPFPACRRGQGKKRPVIVVQADVYNRKLRHVVVAEITTNLAEASDPANLLIEVGTPEGQATGLVQDSVLTCLHLVTMSEDRIKKMIGKLSPALLQKMDDCLKAALGLP